MANEIKTKKSFSFRRLIFNDKYLIVTSIFLAILVWAVTSLSMGESDTKDIVVNKPLSLSNKVSEQLGMQYYTDSESFRVDIKISGAKYTIGQVDEDDIEITFDASNISRTGLHNVPVKVKNKSNTLDFEIDDYTPRTVEAYFDTNEEKTLELNLNYDQLKLEDGYAFGEPVISEDKVVVSGPKSYVEKVDRANLIAKSKDEEKLTKIYNNTCDITLESDSGSFEERYISLYSKSNKKVAISSVDVTIPVVKLSEVPVKVTIEDKPKGVKDSDIEISYSVDSLSVGFLDGADVKELNIGSVSFNDLATGKNEFKFKTSEIKGVPVVYDEDQEISVVITIDESEYVKKETYIDASMIKITGAPEGSTARITDISNTKIVTYVPSDASDEDVEFSEIKCDISKESTDKTYPLSFKFDDQSSWVYGDYSVTVETE